jgi:cytochrome c peroxidase
MMSVITIIFNRYQSLLALTMLGLCVVILADNVNADANTDANTNISEQADKIVLSEHCPASFELVAGNKCELRTLYQMYDSLQNKGVGGLKTALPPGYRNGFSPQQIDLGRYLFFDPILSKNQDMSCASCHQPEKGFSDGLPRSMGANNKELTRAAPSLWNSAFLHSFFWDGRAKTLEEQAKSPLFSDVEMANTPKNLLKTLQTNDNYRRLFRNAFPAQHKIELDSLYAALTAFESSLISLNSRYDQYAHGYHEALNENEIAGLNIFRSFVARCAECHTPPLFTNQQIAVIGAPEPDGIPFDPGAQIPLNDTLSRGGFKVPSLRNINRTAPYMHSGKFDTLKETTKFYTGGRGHAVPKDETLYLHWHIWEPDLRDEELDLVVEFLQTLTDESFMPVTPKVLPSGLKLAH